MYTTKNTSIYGFTVLPDFGEAKKNIMILATCICMCVHLTEPNY